MYLWKNYVPIKEIFYTYVKKMTWLRNVYHKSYIEINK
jgi:hypothetical protein